jgi:hypothetical protein
MTQNNGSKYAPGYDLFKLSVAVILTIILILLLLQESRRQYMGLSLTAIASSVTEPAGLPAITTQPLRASTSTPLPTFTPQPVPTEPTFVEPIATELVPTQTPPPTETAIAESIPALDQNGCPAIPFHVQVGNKVVIKNWLNFRTGPGLYFKIQRTNRPGTELEVIGGPVCTIRVRDDHPRAYIWWKVRMQDGREGWSVQAPLNESNYLLEPVR